MDLELIYREGDRMRRQRFAPGRISIGRDPGCEVVLDRAEVAPVHAFVTFDRGLWALSTAGEDRALELRGRRIKYAALAGLTQVTLAGTRITFLVHAPEPAASEGAGHVRSSRPVGDFQSLLDTVLDPRRRSDPASPAPIDVARLLRVVRSAAEAFVGRSDVDALLDTICALVVEQVAVDRVFVLLGEGPAATLETRAVRARPGLAAERVEVSRTIADEALSTRRALLVVEAADDARFCDARSVAALGIRSALCAPLADGGAIQGLLYADRTSTPFGDDDLDTLAILASIAAAALQRARLQEGLESARRARERLARYHAPAVVEHVLAAGRDAGMLAEARDVTVLFADLVGFTSLCERLPAERVQRLLNTVLEALTAEVFREHGTLDKFIGDAVMVFFGAPVEQPDHALRAVRVALEMHRRVAALRGDAPELATLALRVGIDSGPAIVGEIGALARRDYTVIGDTVNVASRLESSVAGPGETIVSDRTHALVSAALDAVPLEPLALRGRAATVRPWRVRGLAPEGTP